MSDFDDAIGGMMADLLSEAGVEVTYVRQLDRSRTLIQMVKSSPPAEFVTADEQTRNNVQIVDWKCLTSALPATPQKGDKIQYNGKTYEVLPTELEPVARVTSDQMTRVHTKLVFP
jgi:hypothetical protein